MCMGVTERAKCECGEIFTLLQDDTPWHKNKQWNNIYECDKCKIQLDELTHSVTYDLQNKSLSQAWVHILLFESYMNEHTVSEVEKERWVKLRDQIIMLNDTALYPQYPADAQIAQYVPKSDEEIRREIELHDERRAKSLYVQYVENPKDHGDYTPVDDDVVNIIANDIKNTKYNDAYAIWYGYVVKAW